MSIIHNKTLSRFEITINNSISVLEYYVNNNTIIFTHTGVPSALEGRGIGTSLCKAGIDYAISSNLTIIPECWFVSNYMKKNNIPSQKTKL